MIRTGRKYTPEEVLQHFKKDYVYARGKSRVDFDGHGIKMGSDRYWTFVEKGLTCVRCGIEGEFFIKEKHRSTQGENYHFNLYGIDDEGDEVLMTKDHIVPKAEEGPNHISNYQTMCKVCNEAKAYEAQEGAKPFNGVKARIQKLFKRLVIENLDQREWGFFFEVLDAGVSLHRMNNLSSEFDTYVVQCQAIDKGRMRVKVVTDPTTS